MAQIKLFGYTDKISVKPGETVAFHVNADGTERAEAQLVRLIHGDTSPDGPGFKEELVETEVSGEYPGRLQETDAGSCVVGQPKETCGDGLDHDCDGVVDDCTEVDCDDDVDNDRDGKVDAADPDCDDDVVL